MSFRLRLGVFVPVSFILLLSFQNCSVYKGEGLKYLESSGHNLSSQNNNGNAQSKLSASTCTSLQVSGLAGQRWIENEYQNSCVIHIVRNSEHSIVCSASMDHLSLFLSLEEKDPSIILLENIKEGQDVILHEKSKNRISLLSLEDNKQSAILCYELIVDPDQQVESQELLKELSVSL